MTVEQSDRELLIAHGVMGGIPREIGRSLADYLRYGMVLGPFLRAVVTNDLRQAMQHGNIENRMRIPRIIEFLDKNADPRAFGSVERYETWVKTKAYTIDPSGQPTGTTDGPRVRGRQSGNR